MKTIKYLGVLLLLLFIPLTDVPAQQGSGLKYRPELDIQVWTNKEDGATFYRGEDLAVYFRANHDCYILVYEIDTDGNINVLFPEYAGEGAFINGNKTYRIPPADADYHMEIGGAAGDEYIYAVASPSAFTGPDWMVYWGLEYNEIGDDWVVYADAGRNDALDAIIGRLASETGGPFTSGYVSFNIEPQYRHYLYYPPQYYHYRYGSIWIGADYPGCEIFIDGIYYGITPLYVPSILCGGHVVILYYYGYPCWQDYFWVDYCGYYRIDAAINYRYVRHIDRGNRYKYWSDWDFGGKDYRRPKKYKESGGYTYKHPEPVLKYAGSKYKNSPKVSSGYSKTVNKDKETLDPTKPVKTYGSKKSISQPKSSSKSRSISKQYHPEAKVYGDYKTGNKTVDTKSSNNVIKKKTADVKKTSNYSRIESKSTKSKVTSPKQKTSISKPKTNKQSSSISRTTVKKQSSSSGSKVSGEKKKSSSKKSKR
jgi:hypothetical protein